MNQLLVLFIFSNAFLFSNYYILPSGPHICEFPKVHSDINFYFYSTVIGEHTLYDFNSFKFIEACFYDLEYNLYWKILNVHLRILCILLFGLEQFIDIYEDYFVVSVFKSLFLC